MKNIKEKFNEARADILAELTVEANQLLTNPTKKQKVGLGLYTGAAIGLGTTAQAMAAANFFDKLGDMMSKLYGWVLGVSTGIAVVMIAISFVLMMIATDPQAARGHKETIKRVLVAWIGINLLGALATVISELTSGQGFGGASGTFNKWHS